MGGTFSKRDKAPPALPAPLRVVLDVHVAKACHLMVVHRVPDAIEASGGTIDLPTLLTKTSIATEDYLYRLLRCCESQGIFSVRRQDSDDVVTVTNTPSSMMLVRDAPNSLAPMILHAMHESALALNHLDDLVTSKDASKTTAWDFYSKIPYWAWLDQEEQRETLKTFNTLMVNVSLKEIPFIVNGFDWKAFLARISNDTCSVVDVGGGKGHLLKGLLEVASFKPIVFDTPNMVDDAAEYWEGIDVELVKGDFFKANTIPQASCYLLKHILHDWSDEKSVEILKAIREQASKVENSRVMLIELVLNESVPLQPFEQWLDVQMMNMVGGKERSLRQWRALLASAGFKLEAVHTTGGTEGILECSVDDLTLG